MTGNTIQYDSTIAWQVIHLRKAYIKQSTTIPRRRFWPPNDLYQLSNKTKSKHLHIDLYISSISFHIDDLTSLITNRKTKLKVNGISGCRRKGLVVDFTSQILILITLFIDTPPLNHQKEDFYYVLINH